VAVVIPEMPEEFDSTLGFKGSFFDTNPNDAY